MKINPARQIFDAMHTVPTSLKDSDMDAEKYLANIKQEYPLEKFNEILARFRKLKVFVMGELE